jgi:Domain of unknown function (DUF1905)
MGEPSAAQVFTAELWAAEAMGAWMFVTVPRDVSDEVRLQAGPPKGFGSVRVEVSLGSTTWLTSVFPDAASRCYVLPVKKVVRRAEEVDVGDDLTVSLRVIELDGSADGR